MNDECKWLNVIFSQEKAHINKEAIYWLCRQSFTMLNGSSMYRGLVQQQWFITLNSISLQPPLCQYMHIVLWENEIPGLLGLVHTLYPVNTTMVDRRGYTMFSKTRRWHNASISVDILCLTKYRRPVVSSMAWRIWLFECFFGWKLLIYLLERFIDMHIFYRFVIRAQINIQQGRGSN